jgi:hypothetical protein
MPPARVGAVQVGGPVGEPHLLPPSYTGRQTEESASVVGELVPDAVGGGGAGEQRPVRPGDQVGERAEVPPPRKAASASKPR